MKKMLPLIRKMNVFIALVMSICITVIAVGCGSEGLKEDTEKKVRENTDPVTVSSQIEQKIVFIRELYYSGENSKGLFIDKDGNVRSFDFSSQSNHMEWVDVMNQLESSDYNVIATVNLEDLYYYYNLLKQISQESEISYIENTNDVVLGFNMMYGVLFQTDGTYKYIQISGSGDAEIINKDTNAVLINEWLQKVLPNFQ